MKKRNFFRQRADHGEIPAGTPALNDVPALARAGWMAQPAA
jgi:hypothetical protein